MVIADGEDIEAEDHLNAWGAQQNLLMGKSGTIEIPVYINNVTNTRKVRLALFGRKAGATSGKINHGAGEHRHTILTSTSGSGHSTSGYLGDSGNEAVGWAYDYTDNTDASKSISIGLDGTNVIADTAVPQAVQIWIDGTEYTATIGDPNTKGATMYDSTNDDWGIDGTTEWDTGWLTLDSVISWTAGWHTIKIVETGDVGGTLIYLLSIMTGANQ